MDIAATNDSVIRQISRALAVLILVGGSAQAGTAQSAARAAVQTTAKPASAPSVSPAVAPDYRIGADDVLNIVFWREPDLGGEVVVRPDGKISLPLINDVAASGLTPAQLREVLAARAKTFIADPNVSVVVRQINSRKVFITGNVERPGPYALGGSMTVLQLIALAGGLREYADAKHIVVMRTENGRSLSLPFNYNDIRKRKNLRQNVALEPGDTVIVP